MLPALNSKLAESGNKYFGGCLTIADIQYYCEINTILALSAREISKNDMPSLHEWYYMSMRAKNPELVTLEQQFLDTLAKNKRS